MPLTGRQKRFLRGLGHHLDPVVLLGKDGLSEGVIAKVNAELGAHELVKVRLGEDTELAGELAKETRSELVQQLGKTGLYYRRRPKDPEIVLPKP